MSGRGHVSTSRPARADRDCYAGRLIPKPTPFRFIARKGRLMASDESVQFVNPTTLPPSPGYTQVVIAPSGRTAHISGQVALDTSGAIVGPGDFRAQARQVFENLKAALAA